MGFELKISFSDILQNDSLKNFYINGKISFSDILQNDSLKNFYINGKVRGYEFDVRLGYYRGLYLSCLEEFKLTVNGEIIDEGNITFGLNNKEFAVSELKYLISEFWSITVPAKIRVYQKDGLKVGEHVFDLRLMMRSPYLPAPGAVEPHTYVPINSCDKKILTLNC
jgi:hypothetical protein